MPGAIGKDSNQQDELGFVFDVFDPAFRADPYPTYHWMRKHAPCYRHPLGFVVLTRHSDCRQVLRHPHASADRRSYAPFDFWLASGIDYLVRYAEQGIRYMPFLFKDPPDHTRLRRIVAGGFEARQLASLRSLIEEIASEQLERFEQEGGDFVDTVCRPLPVRVIARLIGIPPADEEQVCEWSDVLAQDLEPSLNMDQERLTRQTQAVEAFASYLEGLVQQRIRQPRQDLASRVKDALQAGECSIDEAIATLMLLAAAGHETTRHLLANAVYALASHPHQWELLKSAQVSPRQAVEETLRFDTPVQMLFRRMLGPVETTEGLLQAGSDVLVVAASANRDDSVFSDPDRFDLSREPGPVLSFGSGPHHCLGSHLARLEAEVAIGALVERYENIALGQAPQRNGSVVFRGFTKLPLAFEPASSRTDP